MRLSASSLGCRARALSASRRGGSTLAWRITPLNTKSWSAVCIRRRRARISFPVIASRPLCDTIRIARSQHPTELPLKHTDFHRQVSWYSKGRALHTNIYFAARRRVTNSAGISDSYLPLRRSFRRTLSNFNDATQPLQQIQRLVRGQPMLIQQF